MPNAAQTRCTEPNAVQPLDGSISVKFSIQTRLDSKSFETLIDLLAFLVQKSWIKINKIVI